MLIMRAAHHRRANLLDERNVFRQIRIRHRPALVLPVLMFAHAVEMIRLAVQKKAQLRVHMIKAQAQGLLHGVHQFVGGMQLHDRAVQIRVQPAVPQMWLRHGHLQAERLRHARGQHNRLRLACDCVASGIQHFGDQRKPAAR